MESIGIDLGANCCIAILKNDKVNIIENVPVYVGYDETNLVFGEQAKQLQYSNPRLTYYDFHLLKSPLQQWKKEWGFERKEVQGKILSAIPHKNPVTFDYYTFEELEVCFLENLLQSAESYLDLTSLSAIVAIPSSFNDQQIKMTKQVIQLAGCAPCKLIDKNNAILLASNYLTDGKYCDKNAFLFDFGEKTLSVAIMQGDKTIYNSVYDNLGGASVTNKVITYLRKYLLDTYQYNIEFFEINYIKLIKLSEEIKINLSTHERTCINLKELLYRFDEDYEISRSKFEEINEEVFDMISRILTESFSSVNISEEDVDVVIMTGGSSNIHKVKDLIKYHFKKAEVFQRDNLVAIGAALKVSNNAKCGKSISKRICSKLIFGAMFMVIVGFLITYYFELTNFN